MSHEVEQDSNEYKAFDVCTGSNCTFVIGYQLERTFINFEECAPELQMIFQELNKILLKEGSLEKFFELGS